MMTNFNTDIARATHIKIGLASFMMSGFSIFTAASISASSVWAAVAF